MGQHAADAAELVMHKIRIKGYMKYERRQDLVRVHFGIYTVSDGRHLRHVPYVTHGTAEVMACRLQGKNLFDRTVPEILVAVHPSVSRKR